MSIFKLEPKVELLQWLAPGALKQNLSKAVRLWVILRSIYGEETDEVYLGLPQKFTYNQWRDRFFTDAAKCHLRDRIPEYHEDCRCNKSLNQWLFHSDLSPNDSSWKDSFLQIYPIDLKELNSLLDSESRLFATSGKNLQYHFKTLIRQGYLEATQEGYQQVELPTFQLSKSEETERAIASNIQQQFIQSELGDIANYFSQPINGTQRFFFHVEYIISSKLAAEIEILQTKLKAIWAKDPVPPVQLSYCSAKQYQAEFELILYPVCIYYWQRAPYLLAFGQTPKDEMPINWYDYRLDRINRLEELTWNEVAIDNFNLEICQTKTPDVVENLMAEAWGFDFYQPSVKTLLRFDRYFYHNYIHETERQKLFKEIDADMARILVKNSSNSSSDKRIIMARIEAHPRDIYCLVNCRENDNNIVMRLRAWGDKVEVMLPQQLRCRMKEGAEQTWMLYRDEPI